MLPQLTSAPTMPSPSLAQAVDGEEGVEQRDGVKQSKGVKQSIPAAEMPLHVQSAPACR